MPMCVLTPNVGCYESRGKDNRGSEDINKAIKYQFADGNKRRSVVEVSECTRV